MVKLILEEDTLGLEFSALESFGAFTWCCGVYGPLQIPYSDILKVTASGKVDSLLIE